ncbi:hypothetical protein L2E82_45198 [Cichorium intybus]|uniref:Uncharacterized protein n=1 Tax=Cichorium intybus TaxID=13427 RepID=A0ACB8ZS77_CICIN|nr:hypothetical protein L2E82_45198 [Cichorium intybus]
MLLSNTARPYREALGICLLFPLPILKPKEISIAQCNFWANMDPAAQPSVGVMEEILNRHPLQRALIDLEPIPLSLLCSIYYSVRVNDILVDVHLSPSHLFRITQQFFMDALQIDERCSYYIPRTEELRKLLKSVHYPDNNIVFKSKIGTFPPF